METRLAELQAEHERGTSMLTQMDRERANLAQTLQRISGAIQVLDELLRTFVFDELKATGASEAVGEGVTDGLDN